MSICQSTWAYLYHPQAYASSLIGQSIQAENLQGPNQTLYQFALDAKISSSHWCKGAIIAMVATIIFAALLISSIVLIPAFTATAGGMALMCALLALSANRASIKKMALLATAISAKPLLDPSTNISNSIISPQTALPPLVKPKAPVKDEINKTRIQLLEQFYLGLQPIHTANGKATFDELLHWNFDQLENCHNYIQWLFPTQKESVYNDNSPVLFEDRYREDIDRMSANPLFRKNMMRAFDCFLQFLGISVNNVCDADGNCIQCHLSKAENFSKRFTNWQYDGSHNQKRITRILHCLHLFGFTIQFNAFRSYLAELVSQGANGLKSTYEQYWSGPPERVGF